MNICMFTNTYLPHVGGVARSVASFAEDLRKMGHRVLVVAPTFPHMDFEENGDEVIRVPAIQNFNGSDFSVRIPLPFLVDRKIQAFGPHVIHSHHPYLLGDTALRVARELNRPLVFTYHTLYEKYTHYVPLDSEAMRQFAIHLSTAYANLCTKVVAPSRSLAQLITKRGVKRPIEEIPTGVDVPFFCQGRGRRFREAHGISEDFLVIGHLGRLAPEKNLKYLVEAVALFLEQEKRACFLVAGRGPSEGEIRETLERRGLKRRLFMVGNMTGSDLSGVYKAMDLFVFASQTETQGMVLTEAMAAGRPVIALDASGPREVVEDGRNGRLLPVNTSPEAFAMAMSDAVKHPELVKKWRQQALRTAEQFSRDVCAERLGTLYKSICDHRCQDGRRHSDDLAPWESLLGVLKAEWDLVSQKTTAMVHTMRATRKTQLERE